MVRRWSVVVIALVFAAALAGCSSDDPTPALAAEPTAIARLDVSSVRLARAEFCDRMPKTAVRRALGAAPDADESWGNGDPVPGEGGSGDVGHEIGCAWTGADDSAARAWVFARPIGAELASTLVRQAGHHAGCTVATTKVFGDPALLQSCTSPGGVHRLRRAGLFADTWVTCEVSARSTSDLRKRVDQWCASVVAGLDTAGG